MANNDSWFVSLQENGWETMFPGLSNFENYGWETIFPGLSNDLKLYPQYFLVFQTINNEEMTNKNSPV